MRSKPIQLLCILCYVFVSQKNSGGQNCFSQKLINVPAWTGTILFCTSGIVTVRPSPHVSPFFILHGMEPLLLFDLAEASYLSNRFTKGMTTEDLLVAQIIQLTGNQLYFFLSLISNLFFTWKLKIARESNIIHTFYAEGWILKPLTG